MVKKIVNNDMSEVMSSPVAVVDFSAVWCGPCRMLAPVLDEIAEEMSDKVAFFNADSDDNSVLAAKYNIMSIPAVLIFKDGKEVDRAVGFQPKQSLKGFISSHC